MVSLLSDETVNYIKSKIKSLPEVAMVLGSGLKVFEELENEVKIKFSDIPDFPQSTVKGHSGIISFGEYKGKQIAILRGRFHKYEGYDWKKVVTPVLLMHELGVKKIVLTNSAGGINRKFVPGELMLIEDHINYQEISAAERKELNKYIKHKEVVEYYEKDLRKEAHEIANNNGIKIHEGIYLSLTGPSYETRAEILMCRKMGVDAVGMSTVPEAIWAKALGMKVLGISCITNSTYYEKAMSETSHQEVVDVAKTASKSIDCILSNLLEKSL